MSRKAETQKKTVETMNDSTTQVSVVLQECVGIIFRLKEYRNGMTERHQEFKNYGIQEFLDRRKICDSKIVSRDNEELGINTEKTVRMIKLSIVDNIGRITGIGTITIRSIRRSLQRNYLSNYLKSSSRSLRALYDDR